jgi:hypothetical protein
MATRPGEGQRNYRDLRERTKRLEDRREENLKRIVELYRARYLHSFPDQILSGAAGGAGTGA